MFGVAYEGKYWAKKTTTSLFQMLFSAVAPHSCLYAYPISRLYILVHSSPGRSLDIVSSAPRFILAEGNEYNDPISWSNPRQLCLGYALVRLVPYLSSGGYLGCC